MSSYQYQEYTYKNTSIEKNQKCLSLPEFEASKKFSNWLTASSSVPPLGPATGVDSTLIREMSSPGALIVDTLFIGTEPLFETGNSVE